MLHLLVASAFLVGFQEDKVPPKKLEDRLKELEEKLTALEKRHETLQGENQALERRLADVKTARQNYIKQTAAGWVERYRKAADFSEKQAATFAELWTTWTTSDLVRSADRAGWKAREEAIQANLSPEQVTKLTRAIHDEQEGLAKAMIGGLAQQVRISPEHAAAFEKAVLAKVSLPEGILLVQAHPEVESAWIGVYGITDRILPDLAPSLSEDELSRLRDLLGRLKLRK